jgi:hypothetical protein
MSSRDRRAEYPKLYRYTVGGANLGLTAMLGYGLVRYVELIVPRYGHRFAYIAVLIVGVAGWTTFRGVLLLVGRSRGRRS